MLLIQASAKVDQAAYAEYLAAGIELPPAEELVTGAIIGAVQVIGCIRDSRSLWAIPGYWQWVSSVPRAADPVIPVKGQLSMFAAPAGWERRSAHLSSRSVRSLVSLSTYGSAARMLTMPLCVGSLNGYLGGDN